MPTLQATSVTARIVWLGTAVMRAGLLSSDPATELFAAFSGIGGEAHAGLTRPSCSRVLAQYPRGTTIRNTRQLSILSAEELAAIAAAMGLAQLDPALLGTTMVVEGIPDFTHVPPASRLQSVSGATLVVDMENAPCTIPARAIEVAHPGAGAAFKPAARGRRGVTAWVEREGTLRLGDAIRLHIPTQRQWAPKPVV
jgi:hypothetical protein